MNQEYNRLNVKVLSIIAYLGPLFIAGKLAVEKSEPLVKFHSSQGAILFGFEIVSYLLTLIICLLLSSFPAAQEIIGTLLFVAVAITSLIMAIMGIVSASKNQLYKLPFIGNINNLLKRP